MSTVQTQNSSSTSNSANRVAWNRLWLAGLVAIVAAVAINSLIRIIALAILPIPAASLQFRMAPLIPVFTVIGVLGALLVFALMNRFARNPIKLFRTVATVVLVISFIPDLLLLATPMDNIASALALIVLHIVTYLICVVAFTGSLTTGK